ncbi:phospholipid/cholesterol/gamma-HCH transport system substrate-binding protein [Rhodococcus sp. SMB37]|uniref:MCE family protein n=1 Tax=Rhodococcus sp. SMB37 TaxID=2512213 RepID=UPI001050E2E8|nr:MCE family protein [Rhodococcus sp. SMB37]TCN49014.1 phospholipid/cholesterol/gamma-HCH transport system substrate-binding protein [Rhodococcus sp. SMB37]
MKSNIGPGIQLAGLCMVGVLAAVIVGNTLERPVIGPTSDYAAEFTNVEGLTPGSDVTLAGVRVGQVSKVRFEPQEDGTYRAAVEFEIESGHELTTDVLADINYGDMIGVRYVALSLPEGASGQVLEPGSTIPIEQTTPPVDLTALLNGFKPLFEAIDPAQMNSLASSVVDAFQGQGATLESLLLHVASVSTDIVEQEQVFNDVIVNLEQLATVVDRRSDEVSQLISGMNVVGQALAGDTGQLATLIDRGSSAVRSTSVLMSGAMAPLDTTVTDLRAMTDAWIPQTDEFNRSMALLPELGYKINRIGDYGGWLNLYMCNFTIESNDFEANIFGSTYSEVCR